MKLQLLMFALHAMKIIYDILKTGKLPKNVKSESGNGKPEIDEVELDKIILTIETFSKDFEVKERLGIISSESALGMNVFRDIFTNVRDLVGGKSVSTQKILKD